MGKGFNVAADIVNRTADGRDINDMWAEFQATVALRNSRRQPLIDLLTFPVTNVIEDVPQIGQEDFEEASEFGVPKGIRPQLTYFSLAYTFKWYDLAKRNTWRFLADATAAQVEANHQVALDADNRLVFKTVMHTLFRNTNRSATINGQSYNVYALYNNDGTVPPEYAGNTFDGTHTHYLVSGAAGIDSGDFEAMIEHLRHHGYSPANGMQLVALVNPAQSVAIRTWRANTANANGAVALYDFIPASNQPSLIVPNSDGLLGTIPPSSFQGFSVIGSYGSVLIIEEDYCPAGYVAMIATGGAANLRNPVGIRMHPNASLQGLLLLGGNQTGYPLIESFYTRGLGTGIRQRGGTVIMQIKASGNYDIPALYANVP